MSENSAPLEQHRSVMVTPESSAKSDWFTRIFSWTCRCEIRTGTVASVTRGEVLVDIEEPNPERGRRYPRG